MINWNGNLAGFKRRQVFVGMMIVQASISVTSAAPAAPLVSAPVIEIVFYEPGIGAVSHEPSAGAVSYESIIREDLDLQR